MSEKKKSLKICMFTTVHRPFDVRVFHREARTLAEASHQVVLLAHADFTEEHRHAVTVKGIRQPSNRFFRLLSLFRFARRCLKEKADVYHFHDLELLPVGLLLKWCTHKRIIYDCHENYPEAAYERAWYPDWLKPWISKFIEIIEPAMARRLDHVICVVPDQQERFEQKGCHTVLVRNLPRLEIFDAAYKKHFPKLNRLIYVGGLTVVRGAKILVDIMAELKKTHPQTRLLCLGPFNESHVEEQVKKYMREKHVEEIIEHIRFVPHEQVADYIVQSRIGLIPWQPNQQMLRMVFPNKVFEYMACGIPVVSSDLPSLRYIFGQAQSGIIVPADDAHAHADAIRSLLDDDNKSRELGENGRASVLKRYNWNIEAKKLLTIYKKYSKENL